MEKHRNQIGFIQISTLAVIVFGVVILGGFGYNEYKNYKSEKLTNDKLSQELAITQQKTIEEEKEKQDLEVAKLREEVEALKNKKPETKEVPVETPVQIVEENDLPSIIQYWRPIIAHIECDHPVVDTSGNFQYQEIIIGSGMAVYIQSSDKYVIWTNRHVTRYSGGKLCRISFPDSDSPLISIKARVSSRSDEDFAIVDIPKPNEYLQNTIKSVSNTPPFFCSQEPAVGEKIVILGYPGIGSQADVTATEGIISGYDGNYFITSAKVERGNSGGAAILIKDNCYLGIPSFAQVGVIESLARILYWRNFNN